MIAVETNAAEFRRALATCAEQLRHAEHEVTVEASCIVARELVDGGRHSPGTPTRSGWHRGSWVAGLDAPAPGPNDPRRDPIVADPLSPMLAVIRSAQPGQAPVISSDGPAMPRLEEGWSGQAPSGFVRHVIAAGDAIVDEATAIVRRRYGWEE